MARIRTIKPEFWTDERLTECSLSARLLFIGMLNFADDNGNQGYSAKRLKMQIFPADSIDTQPLLDELLTQGVIIEYSVSGEKYLHIKGFRAHQVINRPSATKIPQPDFIVDSSNTHGALTDGREGKGKERKGIKTPAGKPAAPRRSSTSLSDYLEACKQSEIKPIPPDHPVRTYCKDAGIDNEMRDLAWLRFKEDHTTGARKAKRYTDWPAAFANCVKDNWYRLWIINADGPANWTSNGIGARKVADARPITEPA